MTKIEVQCECGTFTPVIWNKQNGIFVGKCPNSECQIYNIMRVTELETQRSFFESHTNDVKECPQCGEYWVNTHTCKAGDKFKQQKAIMENIHQS